MVSSGETRSIAYVVLWFCVMNLSNLRAVSNDYQQVRLVSLRNWKYASAIEPRDMGGPYVVVQDGYDPHDMTMSYDEFLIGKSGAWIPVGIFYMLASDMRRQEFVFGTAAEVIELLTSLHGKPLVVTRPEHARLGGELKPQQDDLTVAFSAALREANGM